MRYFFSDVAHRGRYVRFIKPDIGLSALVNLDRDDVLNTLNAMLPLAKMLERVNDRPVIIKYGGDTFHSHERISEEDLKDFLRHNMVNDEFLVWDSAEYIAE